MFSQQSKLIHLLSCLALAALASPAGAGQAAEPQQGMVVVRDAETGELRAPTPLEARALHPRTNASAAAAAAPAPKMVVGPGGRRSVQLGERHMVYSVVTRGADGKLAEQCVHGTHAADHALSHGAAAPATKESEEHRHEKR